MLVLEFMTKISVAHVRGDGNVGIEQVVPPKARYIFTHPLMVTLLGLFKMVLIWHIGQPVQGFYISNNDGDNI